MAVDLGTLSDDVQYRVKLSKPVVIGQLTLSPTTLNTVKGRVLKGFPADSVEAVEELRAGDAGGAAFRATIQNQEAR